MSETRRRATGWLARWGFSVLVVADACFALWAMLSEAVPADVPSYALQAALVYRLEIGAVAFVVAYVFSLAVVLALDNRAFLEIGKGSLKAGRLGGSAPAKAFRDQAESLDALMGMVEDLRAELDVNDRRSS